MACWDLKRQRIITQKSCYTFVTTILEIIRKVFHVHTTRPYGDAENGGHENDGPSKLQGMILQDMKMQDMKLQDMKLQDMKLIAFCSILVFFLYFDADVAAMEMCNVIIKWIEKKSNMIHVTSLREELSKQVTTPRILICNINNEPIKICSSCEQFSTV